MSNLRQAAQQALEAIKKAMPYASINVDMLADAAAALRAALAEPEQEPVAWMCPDDPDRRTAFSWPGTDRHSYFTVPLYTAPTPRKPPQFPTMLRKMWSGDQVQEWIDENWNK